MRSTRLEVACGEAPYITSRYDATTGEPIPLTRRVGLLDRKLRLVSENCHTSGEWLEAAREAYQSTYAFEWQGDNLLLAREALYYTYLEAYEAKFGSRPPLDTLLPFQGATTPPPSPRALPWAMFCWAFSPPRAAQRHSNRRGNGRHTMPRPRRS